MGVDEATVQARLGARRDDARDRSPAQVVAERHAARVPPDEPGLVEGPQRGQCDAEVGQQVIGDRSRRAREQVE